MNQHGNPTDGAETSPGEGNVTSKTARRIEPGPATRSAEERAADGWVGQDPEDRAGQGGAPAAGAGPDTQATAAPAETPGERGQTCNQGACI